MIADLSCHFLHFFFIFLFFLLSIFSPFFIFFIFITFIIILGLGYLGPLSDDYTHDVTSLETNNATDLIQNNDYSKAVVVEASQVRKTRKKHLMYINM